MSKHTRLAECHLTIWKNMEQELKKGRHFSILSSVPSFVIRQCKLSSNAKSLIWTNRLCLAIAFTSNIESIERLKGLHFYYWRSPYNSSSIRRYISFLHIIQRTQVTPIWILRGPLTVFVLWFLRVCVTYSWSRSKKVLFR